MSRRSAPRADDGETLIEIVISVALVSVAVVMIVAAISAGASLSIEHKRLTDTDVALKRAAELVKSQTYVPNAVVASYSVSSLTGLNGVTVAVSSVQCLPNAGGSQTLSSAGPCNTGAELQVITLRATATGTDEQTVILKRRSS